MNVQTTAVKRPELALEREPRRIVHRTRGRKHGEITRLMSPGDLGEVLKPFVFLDLFDMKNATYSGPGLHPHSGIATVTHLFEGSIRYEDTTGATGVLPAGGVEWFKAAQGAWHGGGVGESGRARGFQLWIALGPDEELGPVESIYQSPDAIRSEGPARVLVGAHGKTASALKASGSLNYLSVRLKAGESWRFQPGADQTTAWIALGSGRVRTPDAVDAGELGVFAPSSQAIEIQAEADSEFVFGAAAPHRHDLVLGYYSVHTGIATLEAGERKIREIGERLKREGRIQDSYRP